MVGTKSASAQLVKEEATVSFFRKRHPRSGKALTDSGCDVLILYNGMRTLNEDGSFGAFPSAEEGALPEQGDTLLVLVCPDEKGYIATQWAILKRKSTRSKRSVERKGESARV